MRLHKKKLLAMGMTAGLAVLSAFPALAGEWVQLQGGEYWQRQYVEADGTFPVSTWKQIDGNMYYFDKNGYTATGWRYIGDETKRDWYYFETNGVMLSNLVCHGGYLDANGVWVSDRIPPESLNVATLEDTNYWTAKLIEYNLLDKNFKNNGDGTYTLTCTYDQYATKPDLCNTVLAKATYFFPNGFSYDWNMVNGTFTFIVKNVK